MEEAHLAQVKGVGIKLLCNRNPMLCSVIYNLPITK